MLGVFDSGIGGLSVANAILQHLPQEQLLYFGDTARIPYGSRPQKVIQSYSFQITEFLLQQGCKAIVVACNTASAAALNELRKQWPEVPFIGMEPAVKPGAAQTQSGKIGVLATAGTISSKRYATLTNTFAKGLTVYEDPCAGLVELIEAGKVHAPETKTLLQSILHPMLEKGVDTFVLGCTHYPFVEPLIKKVVGADAQIINPAPAVARQVARILGQKQLHNPTLRGAHQLYASGDLSFFNSNLKRFFEGPYQLNQLILN